jgi:tetratricopeptide (TPR) repeat protein
VSIEPALSALLEDFAARAARGGVDAFSLPSALDAIKRVAADSDDLEPVKEVAKLQVKTAKESLRLTRQLLERLEALDARQEMSPGRPWLETWRGRLREAGNQADPEQALRMWSRVYMDALARADLSACEEAALAPVAPVRTSEALSELVASGTRALQEGRWSAVAPLLRFFLGALADDVSQLTEWQGAAEREAVAIVVILIGRIEMLDHTRLEQARIRLRQARTLAPESGLPWAALAVNNYAKGEYGDGLVRAQRAVELSPRRPEGYVALGMCTEGQRVPDAVGFYDRAIELVWDEQDPRAALTSLLAPAPSMLLHRLAESALKERRLPLALETLEQALRLTIHDEQNEATWRQEARSYELKSRVLEELDRPEDAARALFEAGKRLGWAGDAAIGVSMLRRVMELEQQLDVQRADTRWQLADSLRMASYEPGSPYVNDQIKESVRIWQDAARLEPPGNDATWVFNLHATINDQLARLPDVNRWELWWEAVADLERSLLLRASPAWIYGYLGRCYRLLNLTATSRDALETCLRLDPGNASALEDLVILLANIGRYDEALDVLPQVDNRQWADAVTAFIYARIGKAENALELISDVLTRVEAPGPWMRAVLTRCYRLLGRLDEARAEGERIWQQRDLRAREDLLIYLWVAFYSERPAEALEALQPVRGDRIEAAEILRLSGLCRLATGDLEGTAELHAGIEAANSLRALDELADGDLPFLEHFAGAGPDGVLIREATVLARARVEARKAEFERSSPPTAEEELAATVAEAGPDAASWAWVGAQAGLARLALEAGRWREAGRLYRALADSRRFDQAQIGLRHTVERSQEAGDQALREDHSEQASRHYTAGLAVASKPFPQPHGVRAGLHARLGLALLKMARYEEAGEQFTRAIRWYATAGEREPGVALGEAVRRVLLRTGRPRDARDFWTVTDAWSTLMSRPLGEGDIRVALQRASRHLFDLLNATFDERGADARFDPLVPPIALELSPVLVPERAGPTEPLLRRRLELPRQHIGEQLGVRVPGVEARQRDQLPAGEYRVLLHEAGVARGKVDPLARYSLLPPEALMTFGVSGQVMTVTRDPLTGSRCCWLPERELDRLVSPVRATLLGPLDYVVRHLEGVLRRNLPSLLGVEEVEDLIARWMDADDGPFVILTALPDRRARLRFARLLRELVRDGVPITDWRRLLDAARGEPLTVDYLGTAVRLMRQRLRELLPGNEPTVDRFSLPEAWEVTLAEHASGRHPRVVLRDSEDTLAYLGAIDDHVAQEDGPVALVVRWAELRPVVRALIEAELELPNLSVLAADELLDGKLPASLPVRHRAPRT